MEFDGLLSQSPISWARRLKTNITMAAAGRSGHLAPHRRICILQRHRESPACNLSSKHICFGGWLERVYCPQNTPMLWQCIIAIIKERVKSHRPSHTQRKAYSFAQGILPYQLDEWARDMGVVGEGLWPSKCSFIMVMHHHHNKGAFWGQ